MNILVTGDVGSGKTTVCEKVVKIARLEGYKCGGVLCPNIHENGKKIGSYIVDLTNDETMVFSKIKEISDFKGPGVGRYMISQKSIEFGKRALRKAKTRDLIAVDEVGLLELSNNGFMPEMDWILHSGGKKLIVVRSSLKNRFIELYPDIEFRIFDVKESNRDKLPEKIFHCLQNGS